MLTANMLPKSRLGKRSTMGALVCGSSCPAADVHHEAPQGETEAHATSTTTSASVACVGLCPRPHSVIRVKLHPGQKVSGVGDVCQSVRRLRHIYIVVTHCIAASVAVAFLELCPGKMEYPYGREKPCIHASTFFFYFFFFRAL